MLHVMDTITNIMNIVTKETWTTCVGNIMWQCLKLVMGLIWELEKQILVEELLSVIRVIYSHYWLVPKAKITFPSHEVAIIHAHFAHLKAWGFFGIFGGPILNLTLLDDQFVLLKLSMQNHYQVEVLLAQNCNMITHSWKRLKINTILNHHIF